MGIPDHLTFLLRHLYEGQEGTVRSLHEQLVCSKLGKECYKAVYSHPTYLTYMQDTSCEMPDCKNHRLESILPGEISTTSDMQIMPL